MVLVLSANKPFLKQTLPASNMAKIENKIAKEQSRVILSEGLTKTKLYMNGTLRSWIHYLNVRTNKDDTQAEHVDLALKIKEEINKIFPLE